MKMKFVTIPIIISFLLGVLVSALPAFAVAASPNVYMSPANNIYSLNNATLGTKFNVTIWVKNAPLLGGAQASIEFNDTVLNVTRWFMPTWDPNFFMPQTPLPPSALPAPPNPGYTHLGSGRGEVTVAVSKGGLPPGEPWGHNGTIAIFQFIITKVPTVPGSKLTSVLKLNNTDTFLLDTTATAIPDLVITDGYYEISKPGAPPSQQYSLTISASSGGTTNPAPSTTSYPAGTVVKVTAIPNTGYKLDHWELDVANVGSTNPYSVTMNANHTLMAVFAQLPAGGPPRIFVDPPKIINPDAIPCVTNFPVNISIANMTNVKTCEFNLTYRSGVIGLIGISLLTVDEQFPSPSIKANDSAGFVWMKLTYPTPKTVSNSTPLVTITFHVRSRGATPLNLTDTKITDGSGNPISHETYNGFFMALIRDVAVTNVVPSRTWAYAGWPVNVTVTVKNKGNMSETFNVSAFYDGTLIGNMTVTDLAPNGGQENIVFVWNTAGVAEGNYTIKAVAQAVPYQLNVTDLTFVNGKVWIMTRIHDVAIVGISLSNTINNTAYKGWVVGINVTAQNLGSFTETFNVSAYYNSTFLIGTAQVTNLAPSGFFKTQFSLNTSTLLPCHKYPISANATQVPYEYNTTNNFLADGSLKVRLVGDVNGDGKVNLADVYAVAMAFGTMPGLPRWNVWADLNHDLKIDLKDYFAVVSNFGKSCS